MLAHSPPSTLIAPHLPEALRLQRLAERDGGGSRQQHIENWTRVKEFYLRQLLPAVAPDIPPDKWRYVGGAIGFGAIGGWWSIEAVNDTWSRTLDHTFLFKFGRHLEDFAVISEPYHYDGGEACMVKRHPLGSTILESRPLLVRALPDECSAHFPGATSSIVIAPPAVFAPAERIAA